MARINIPGIGYFTPSIAEINLPSLGYFTSAILHDDVAPTVPTALVATETGGNVDLTWGASTDAGSSVTYHVYRDAVLLATVATTTYQDTTVASSTSYDYTVSAFDTSGNESAQTSATTIVTKLGNDSVIGGLFRPQAAINTGANAVTAGGVYRTSEDWQLQLILENDPAGASEYFGFKPEMNAAGDTCVAGVFYYPIDANTPAGAIAIFRRNGVDWSMEQFIPDPEPTIHSNNAWPFGIASSISADGSTIVTSSPATSDDGRVYVYVRSSLNVWSLQQTITSPQGTRFGASHDLSDAGDTLVVLAKSVSYNDPVYVYTRSGTTWSLTQTLSQSQKVITGNTTYYVAKELVISGDGTKLVQSNSAIQSGESFLIPWAYNGSTWVEGTIYEAATAWEFLGFASGISQDGSKYITTAPNKPNGDYTGVGSVVVFSNTGLVLTLDQEIYHPVTSYNDHNFGWTLGMADDGESFVTVEQGTDTIAEAALYFYELDTSGNFIRSQTVQPTDLTAWDYWATAVSMSGDGKWVGAYRGNIEASGLDGQGYLYIYRGKYA